MCLASLVLVILLAILDYKAQMADAKLLIDFKKTLRRREKQRIADLNPNKKVSFDETLEDLVVTGKAFT